MNRIAFLITCFCTAIASISHASEINYIECESISNTISMETQEIANTNPDDHDKLAELYVLRGESYLLNTQYERAIEDFQNACSHLGHSQDIN